MTREKIINELERLKSGISYMDFSIDVLISLERKQQYRQVLSEAIKALEQEPRKGHWISHGEHCRNLGVIPSGLGAYEWCSNCDCGIDVREWYRSSYNYCPNCGADMRDEKE